MSITDEVIIIMCTHKIYSILTLLLWWTNIRTGFRTYAITNNLRLKNHVPRYCTRLKYECDYSDNYVICNNVSRISWPLAYMHVQLMPCAWLHSTVMETVIIIISVGWALLRCWFRWPTTEVLFRPFILLLFKYIF